MTIKEIGNIWRQNFKKSHLVTDGVFNSFIAKQLYYGPNDDADFSFSEGFEDFYNYHTHSYSEERLDTILEYLHYIGITISKKSIVDYIQNGEISYSNVLQKAYYILKTLATYDSDLNIDDPYHDNMGDLFFFLRIEEGVGSQTNQLNLFDELELPDFYNKYIELPVGYGNDETVKNLFDLIENSNKSFFLTGKAGTGKSTFIHYFTKTTKKKVLLFAFTGIAAINIGGQTIHSFFRFPLKPLMPNDPDITIFKSFYQKRKILEETDTIIVDEISMLRSDILEGLDYSLRMNGGNPNKIFGGKQLILVGDIFQLPPVFDSSNEVENELFKIIYQSEYFFDSIAYKKLDPEIFEFSKVHRQSDVHFINLLNKIRDCSIDDLGIEELNKNYSPNYTVKTEDFVLTLTTNNHSAKNENLIKLDNLPYKSHIIKANIKGDYREDKYPTEAILELKRNSQIMLVRNDNLINGRRWVNGTLAKIEFIDENKIEIRLNDDSIHILEKEIWENRQYQWDKNKGRITSKVVGTFEQYPIKLAWAITVHKSQGLTFDKVIIDLGTGAFVNGQVYTALSRSRTLEGIILKKRLTKKDIIADKRIIQFYERNFNPSILNILNSDNELTIKLISCYYPFSPREIEEYWDVLDKGDAHYSVYLDDTQSIYESGLGLCFNKNINWTEDLRSKWYLGFNNPFVGHIIGIGSYPVEYDEKDVLKRLLPLDILKEAEAFNNSYFEYWRRVITPNQSLENETDFEEPFQYDLDKISENIPPLGFKDFKNLYETNKTLIFLNNSIWNNTLKNLMTEEVVIGILYSQKYGSK